MCADSQSFCIMYTRTRIGGAQDVFLMKEVPFYNLYCSFKIITGIPGDGTELSISEISAWTENLPLFTDITI